MLFRSTSEGQHREYTCFCHWNMNDDLDGDSPEEKQKPTNQRTSWSVIISRGGAIISTWSRSQGNCTLFFKKYIYFEGPAWIFLTFLARMISAWNVFKYVFNKTFFLARNSELIHIWPVRNTKSLFSLTFGDYSIFSKPRAGNLCLCLQLPYLIYSFSASGCS